MGQMESKAIRDIPEKLKQNLRKRMPSGSLGRSLTPRELAISEPPMRSPLLEYICIVDVVMKLCFQNKYILKSCLISCHDTLEGEVLHQDN